MKHREGPFVVTKQITFDEINEYGKKQLPPEALAAPDKCRFFDVHHSTETGPLSGSGGNVLIVHMPPEEDGYSSMVRIALSTWMS